MLNINVHKYIIERMKASETSTNKAGSGKKPRFIPLSRKTFIITLLLILLISLANAGFLSLQTSLLISRDTQHDVSDLARAEAHLLNTKAVRDKAKQILDIYNGLTEEQRGDGWDEAYLKRFDPVMDDDFDEIRHIMHTSGTSDDLVSVCIAALDPESGRTVFLIDCDSNEDSFLPPGCFLSYPAEDLHALASGEEPSNLESLFGYNVPLRTIWTDSRSDPYCTGAATLCDYGRYQIVVMVDKSVKPVVTLFRRAHRISAVFLIIISLLAAAVATYLLRRTILRPINQMAAAAASYSEARQVSPQHPQRLEKHFEKLDIRSRDEIGNLSMTMKEMERDISDYVSDLTRITAENERINTELDLARRIQIETLPNDFPAYPNNPEFDLYASTDPAKVVGGDFYDYFLIDNDHLVLEIADVAGKGIPAALFMMSSRIILANTSLVEQSPSQILESANNIICSNNPEEMFVTVWLGILELSTGRIRAASAGHEYPVVIRSGGGPGESGTAPGSAEFIKEKPGFVIGGMEGVKYRDYEIQLNKNDRLFLYTDGVPEATDANKEMFGLDRMLSVLDEDPEADAHRTLLNVRHAVDEFVGEAEQFDDLTMLCLKYCG